MAGRGWTRQWALALFVLSAADAVVDAVSNLQIPIIPSFQVQGSWLA